MSSKAQSGGTKVSAGANDRVIQEGTGTVQPDSLAAESEAFRQANPESQQQQQQQQRPQEGGTATTTARAPGTSTSHTSGTSGTSGTMSRETGSHSGDSSSAADPGPSYINNQFRRDPHGPHGKNITEDDDIDTGDKAKNASFAAEIGSKDDPSLLAERKFAQGNSIAPGSIGGGGQAKVDDKTAFDVLGDREA